MRKHKKNIRRESNVKPTTLEDVLSNKASTTSFREFLVSEFSSENLDFWLECEEYKSLKPHKLKKVANQIYVEYLAPGADKQVNLDSRTKELTWSRIATPSYATFDVAQTHIFNLMQTDSFTRYKRFCKLS
uniref:RGS domain-containing protein n=1 Tax=Ciona savignyi TaxID=51511 RepID=H2YLB5_CIOSA